MYTTAYDLSLIARYAMNNETMRKMVSTPTYTLPSSNIYPSDDRVLKNSNHLIDETSSDYYEYATGIKTGYTNPAQNCLVASAKKDNVEFIAVILGSEQSNFGGQSKFADAKTLFEYGFNNYFDYYHELLIKKQKLSSNTFLNSIIDTNLIVDERNMPRWGYVFYLIAKTTLILIAIIYVSYRSIFIIKKVIYNRTHAKYEFKN